MKGLARRLRALGRADEGSSIVELAIVSPLLILLTIGTVEIGTYLYDGIEVGNAARAAVQYGAQNPTTASSQGNGGGIDRAARADAANVALSSVNAQSYCTCDSAPGTHYVNCIAMPTCAASASDHVDQFLSVTVTGTYVPFLAYPGLPSSLTIRRTADQAVNPS